MEEVSKMRLIASDGAILFEEKTTAMPKEQELLKLLGDKPNKKTSFRMTGPKKENGEVVWEFKQRD